MTVTAGEREGGGGGGLGQVGGEGGPGQAAGPGPGRLLLVGTRPQGVQGGNQSRTPTFH